MGGDGSSLTKLCWRRRRKRKEEEKDIEEEDKLFEGKGILEKGESLRRRGLHTTPY